MSLGKARGVKPIQPKGGRVGVLTVTAVVSIWASALGLASDAQPSSSTAAYGRIAEAIRTVVDEDQGHSLTIGIVEEGKLRFEKHYGSTSFSQIETPNSRTIYPLASITKVLTGIMFLQLVDRGVVHLTDRVDKYVPEITQIPNPYPWTPPVTLMQLATMTSGIQPIKWIHYPADGPFPHPDNVPMTWDQRLVANFPLSKYAFEPGTRRAYSNAGYGILGLALSRAAGRPYEEYVENEIFKPLGMNDSSFAITETTAKRFAYAREEMPRLPSWKQDSLLPAGGAFSTLEDMVKLMRFQLGLGPEGVLPKKALDDSFRLLVASDGDLAYGDAIGFAAARNTDSNLVSPGHGGRAYFYTASYQLDRVSKSGIIVFTTHPTDAFKPVVRESLKRMHPNSSGGTGLPPLEHH